MNGRKASTPDSKQTDYATKEGARLAVQEINDLYGLELVHMYQINNECFGVTPKGKFRGTRPDGGFVLDDGKVILCSEAKKNSDSGNAIERWYHKLFMVRKYFNPEVTFLTFASGDISKTGPIYTKLHPAHSGEDGSINVFTPKKNTLYLKEQWTVEEVKEEVKQCLISLLNL